MGDLERIGVPMMPGSVDGQAFRWNANTNRIEPVADVVIGEDGSISAPSVIGGTLNATAQANDIDMGGYYLTSLQNIADLVARGPSYRFDGVDDTITIADSAQIDFGTGDGSIEFLIKFDNVTENNYFYSRRQDGTNQIFFAYVQASNTLSAGAYIGSGYVCRAIASWAPTEGVWYHLVFTFENGASNALYVNGKPLTLSTDDHAGGDVSIAKDLTFNEWNGTYYEATNALMRQFNCALTAAEVKAFSSGAPIPYKYIGASQTPVTSFDGTSAAGWGINYGTLLVNQSIGGEQALKITIDSSANQHAAYVAHGGVVGKRYRLTFDYYIPSGNSHLDGIWADQNNNDVFVDIGATTDAWNSGRLEFTLTAASAYLKFYGMDGATRTISDPGGDDYFGLDNIALTPIGCVLDLSQDGIGHGQWAGILGGVLRGFDVSGATPTNLPVDHAEKYIDLTVTGDTSFSQPDGYDITSIIFTPDGDIGGGIDFGTTNGGGEVVAAAATSGTTPINATIDKSASYNGSGAVRNIYITDADGTGWDSVTVDIRVTMTRIK